MVLRVLSSLVLAPLVVVGVVLGFACSRPVEGSEPVVETSTATPTPTFTKDVAVILQSHCQVCHRKGEVGPFPLTTYEHARKRAKDIANVTADGTMPPWKPQRGVGPAFKHDPSLSPDEVAVLQAWAKGGAPLGDPKQMPPPVKFPEGWVLGKPDLILEMPEAFSMPASGPDVFRCFVLPTNLPRDVYVTAMEYQPGSRRIVHHILAYIDTSGEGRNLDKAAPGPGYPSYGGPGVDIADELDSWTPGNKPIRLPDGISRSLPAKSDVIIQIHYRCSGKAETDRTRVGFYLARKPVKQSYHWANATAYNFSIPPNASNYEVKTSWFVPVDVELMALMPHMHLIGHDFLMTVTLPTGQSRELIYIPNWDPDWQDTYYLETPMVLPKGSTINVIAHYDNTAHPRNPNKPPKAVSCGLQSTDEMCIGYIGVVKKGQDLTRAGEKDDLYLTLLKQHYRKRVRAEETEWRRSQERRSNVSRP